MASEKQIAADRANAQKSTGPKTAAGKLKSSRNAFRHGLSCPLRLDPVAKAKAEAIVHVLAGDEPKEENLGSAEEFALAQLELLRIRRMRTELMAKIDLNYNNTQQLRRLVALDRYERYVHTKPRRASGKF